MLNSQRHYEFVRRLTGLFSERFVHNYRQPYSVGIPPAEVALRYTTAVVEYCEGLRAAKA